METFNMASLPWPDLKIVTTDSFGGIEGERPALVAPKVHDLQFAFYETARMFGTAQKLILWFSIAEAGEDFGKKVARYYNVTRIIGTPRRDGAFKVAFQSDFLREYTRLFGMPSRLDRIPMSNFDGCFLTGKVKTVTTGRHQQEIPKLLQYSVIEELRELRK
jgi:hypothetical protein